MPHVTIRMIESLAARAGVNIDKIRVGGKRHKILYVSKGDKKGVVTVSSTCNDIRLEQNVISDMRKAVR